jgi:endonuclease-3
MLKYVIFKARPKPCLKCYNKNMNKQKILKLAIDALKKEYPEARCSLNYQNPFQLLIAARLSAQCTDKRVNLVTPVLFKKFPTLDSFCNADVIEVENCIKSCGLYKTKARDIIKMSIMLKNDFKCQLPDNIEDLVKLPGVGRKTANLIIGDIFNKPAVVVDTHCIKITGRLGIHNEKNAAKIEKILRSLLPPEESNNFCHRLVLHGRKICKAQNPQCNKCTLKKICSHVTP